MRISGQLASRTIQQQKEKEKKKNSPFPLYPSQHKFSPRIQIRDPNLPKSQSASQSVIFNPSAEIPN
jgi:hypothetical protein